ncbi:MAG: histidine kinase dimerization/phospho-acceptor domain-containing protein [Kiritimatiellia bacterium]|nr:histidine kinase dimerization/phospho-acceptor domain-containing protein [Kiritimatiellia bacterium]MDP6847926.1 histidine kinase dimerization/phospho-acceptor domain-containing protein [Kiritimatiellia bacterium]
MLKSLRSKVTTILGNRSLHGAGKRDEISAEETLTASSPSAAEQDPSASTGMSTTRSSSASDDLIRALGLAFQNVTVYGTEHSVTVKALQNCFGFVTRALMVQKDILIATCEGNAVVNNEIIPAGDSLKSVFVDVLEERGIGSFTIEQGITWEEFGALVEVLTARPDELDQLGGFAAAISALAICNVQATSTVIVRTPEEDAGSGCGSAGEGSGSGAGNDGNEGDAKGLSEYESVIKSFLQGSQGAADSPEALEGLQKAIADPQQLSSLVTQAAEACHASIKFKNGKTQAALVVECLRRAFEALKESRHAKSMKGKKSLVKALSVIEQDILQWLRDKGEEVSESDSLRLSQSIAGMTDDLEIESLVDDYMKKRSAIETNEKRLMRYIKNKGLDGVQSSNLEQKLLSSGLAISGWQELLIRSGICKDADSAGMEAAGHLSELLSELGEKLNGEGEEAKADGLTNILSGVDHQLAKLVVSTEQKIHALVKETTDDESGTGKGTPAGGARKGLSRKKLMVLLSEIVQELRQPLTVISCAVSTLNSGRAGDTTDQQVELLSLAGKSGERLAHLIDKLAEISGIPKSLAPSNVLEHAA